MHRSLVTAAALGLAFSVGLSLGDGATQTATAAVSPLQTDEQNTISVFAAASPSVVFVESTATRRNPWTAKAFEVPQGSGSGFIWDPKGHIVTNFHVVQGASALSVKLQDGTSWPATVVGGDASKDLAVLKIEAPKAALTPLSRGLSSDLRVGQKVIAIGNPFGLDHTLTSGVISALGREIEAVNGRSITGVVQTDAAINPGNSGGPLLNSQGELIGVNTAIYSLSGASAGIGFAIPADTVSRIVPQLISDGRVRRPALGIAILGDHVSRRAGINGVIIRSTDESGPAHAAGLRGLTRASNGGTELGDVIVAVGEHQVTDADSLFAALEAHKIGEATTVTVLRDGERAKVDVDLGELR
ncbi:MAG: trypsin-like peptidase domain-containing protein [Proteobacteria bacterium]|nr:trypsin-like peptidase domain-containing protein [Pseudomonadota bacterium]